MGYSNSTLAPAVIYNLPCPGAAAALLLRLQVGSGLPTYGVCCVVPEMLHRPPHLARHLYPSCRAPFRRFVVVGVYVLVCAHVYACMCWVVHTAGTGASRALSWVVLVVVAGCVHVSGRVGWEPALPALTGSRAFHDTCDTLGVLAVLPASSSSLCPRAVRFCLCFDLPYVCLKFPLPAPRTTAAAS